MDGGYTILQKYFWLWLIPCGFIQHPTQILKLILTAHGNELMFFFSLHLKGNFIANLNEFILITA